MRSIDLLAVAAEAENLRLKLGAASLGRQAVLAAAAALFGLVALGLLHAAGWIWLAAQQGPLAAALLLALFDAGLMTLLLWLARPRPDPAAIEALRLRRQALALLGETSPIGEAISGFRWRRPVFELGGLLAEHLIRRLPRR
jgi:hypothetical protein